jgi:hypothetical protein
MAWRIEQAVVRGVIDNTVEGRTTGQIWLAGCEAPLELELDGDCWRDLAGTRLQFENPNPQPGPETAGLAVLQRGVIGDMTASKKCKVPTVSEDECERLEEEDEEIPCEWHNTLYLEWFSEFNGRVVIESSSFILTISDHEWELDEDAEAAQKLANLNSMRDFMALVIQRRDVDGPDAEPTGELDEFAWEERLKESDRLTDAYQEVLEKYLDDEDCERKEAFVMGWDGLLDALAEREEAGFDPDFDFDNEGFFEEFDGDDEEDEDDFPGEDGDPTYEQEHNHPLQISSRELATMAMDLVKSDDGPGSPSYELVSSLLQVSGRLAGVLDGEDGNYHPETGFVLAVLKRCLNWLNEALGACQELYEATRDPQLRAGFRKLQAATFQLRHGIIELRRNLKQT